MPVRRIQMPEKVKVTVSTLATYADEEVTRPRNVITAAARNVRIRAAASNIRRSGHDHGTPLTLIPTTPPLHLTVICRFLSSICRRMNLAMISPCPRYGKRTMTNFAITLPGSPPASSRPRPLLGTLPSHHRLTYHLIQRHPLCLQLH